MQEHPAGARVADLGLSIVSHELRNPLAALRAHTDVLNLSPDLVERDRESVAAIARAGARLERILDDLLTVSRGPSGRASARSPAPEPAVVSRSVAEAVDNAVLAALAADVAVEVRGVDDDLRAALPQGDLDRAVLNLVDNAVKFSPRGGRVRIQHGLSGGLVRLAVQDQGPGIAADHLPRLFTPFFRAPGLARQVPGTGLGLAIVREIVEHAGGEVTVSSSPGSGTIFTLWLPRVPDGHGRARKGGHQA